MAVEIKPVANQRGPLRVWEWPKPGNKYVIGIDTGEGVEGGDYSVGFVIEGRTKIHVATYHCSLDPVQFAPRCAALGYLYNRAHLAVERVNHGDAVLRELIHHLKYPEIYRAERAMTSERHATAAVRDFGIDPRAKKAIVVDDLRDAVSRLATIRDHLFYAEGLTWILDEKGRPETAEGAHDDVLMAAGCAFHAAKELYGGFPEVVAPAHTDDDRRELARVRTKRWWRSALRQYDEICNPPAREPSEAEDALL